MKTRRVVIVGCGNIGRVHAQVLHDLPFCEIAACVDIRPERAWEMARKYGCTAYVEMDRALREIRPDAVHLCTPHALHTEQAEMAAEAGAAVFCEKPPAVSREQWERFKAAAEKVPTGICFQNRYNPNVLRAREILASGEAGTVTGVRAFMTWRRDEGYYRDEWHGKWELEGGGTLINQAIHTLDLLVSFLGKPDQVETAMANLHLRGVIPEEDTVAMYLRSGEKRGLLYATGAAAGDEPVILEIKTTRGRIRLEDEELELKTEEGIQRVSCPGDQKLGKSYWGSGHGKCIADFYHSLETGEPFRNSPESCEETMETLFQAYDEGKRILSLELK